MDLEDDYPQDSPTVSYNANATIGPKGRAAVAQALCDFFAEKHKINPLWLGFHFSNSLDEEMWAEDNLRPIGVHVDVSNAFARDEEAIEEVTTHVPNFANDTAVEGYRTFQASDQGFSGNSWQDVVEGLNRSFEAAGSEVRIDPGILKSR